MKPLIIYYSRTGNNEALAQQLQQRLNCPIKVIVDNNKHRSNLALVFNVVFGINTPITVPDIPFQAHDKFILIAPVWAGRIAGPMQTFIRKYKQQLGSYAFATLCGGRPGQREKIDRQLTRLTGKEPLAVLELGLTDLLSSGGRHKPEIVASYSIQQSDWTFFDQSISKFVANIGSSAASPQAQETRVNPISN